MAITTYRRKVLFENTIMKEDMAAGMALKKQLTAHPYPLSTNKKQREYIENDISLFEP